MFFVFLDEKELIMWTEIELLKLKRMERNGLGAPLEGMSLSIEKMFSPKVPSLQRGSHREELQATFAGTWAGRPSSVLHVQREGKP